MNTKSLLGLVAISSLIFAGDSFAQFNQIDSEGRKTLSEAARQQPVVSSQPSSDATIFARGNQNASIYETEFARDPRNKAEHNIAFGQMDLSQAENWSRNTVHSDGSYTVTKEDDSMPEDANGRVSMLKQETFVGATQQLLWERFISLNEKGDPTDVLIYDGRKELRYRGKLLYDQWGRFSEEILHDTNNNILRRKIQPYDAAGNEEKEKVVLYEKNLPPGLQVIVTDEEALENAQTTEHLNWFRAHRERKEMKRQMEAREEANAQQTYVPSEGSKERKGLGAFLFGKKK